MSDKAAKNKAQNEHDALKNLVDRLTDNLGAKNVPPHLKDLVKERKAKLDSLSPKKTKKNK